MVRRLLLAFASLAVLTVGDLSLTTAPAYAADALAPVCQGNAAQTDVCKEYLNTDPTVNPVIKALRITNTILAIFIGIGSTIVIILSGFRMITANGDASKVATGRQGITYALVGIVVAVLSGTIVAFVLNKL